MFPHFYATCNTSLHYRVCNAFWWFFCQRLRPSIIPVHLLMKLITWWLLDFSTYFAQFWLNMSVHICDDWKVTRIVHVSRSIQCQINIWIPSVDDLDDITQKLDFKEDTNPSAVSILWQGSTKPIGRSIDSSNYLFPVQIISSGKCPLNGQFDNV